MNISENVQLADKVYFNTGILSPEDKEKILAITHGDSYTKLIADFYSLYKEHDFIMRDFDINKFYNAVKGYDKNVLPIKGFYSIYDQNQKTIGDLYYAIRYRESIVNRLKQLPQIALRNVRDDIRVPRDSSEMNRVKDSMDYFFGL